jgi:acetyltransferase-like isoleucine patch superfamily enzyme
MAFNTVHATPTPAAHASASAVAKHHHKLELIARRFLIPRTFVTLYGLCRWRATISTRAEVELSPNLMLGRGTTVSSFTKIKATDGVLSTGRKCGFGTGCFIAAGAGGIEIGDNVIFGPNVSVIAVNYRYERLGVPLEEQGATSQGIRIGNNVWIGANAVILDGSVIGDNSIVVATSLVNRRFPANSILQGNPAKVILTRSRS